MRCSLALMRLSDPASWVGPTLEQARADLAVANALLSATIKGPPYDGHPAIDAGVGKLQQAAEKALKAAILALAPDSSGLVFYPHRLLSQADLPGTRRFRALLDRIATVRRRPGLRATLEELESYAPAGASDAETDPGGVIVALPLNTEYPLLVRGGGPQSPARAWRQRWGDAVRLSRAVTLLFRVLSETRGLQEHLADWAESPVAPAR